MTGRATRETVEGRTYLDLQNLARRTDRPTDELHQLYALEGFLDRLMRSAYADRFVLKVVLTYLPPILDESLLRNSLHGP